MIMKWIDAELVDSTTHVQETSYHVGSWISYNVQDHLIYKWLSNTLFSEQFHSK